MSLYPNRKLEEVAEIFSGFAFKSKDMQDEGIPVIKIKNVKDKKVSQMCDQFIPEELLSPKLERYFLQKEDILVAMTGQGSLGRVGKMNNKSGRFLVNQRVGVIRPKENDGAENYLYAVLALDTYEKQLFTIGLGAGQPNVSANDIGNLDIPYPELEERIRISEIRKNYDNLIENNNRRIAILEDMAQSLYQEWFVKFRFPGYQNCKFKESSLGLIPEGWEVKVFTEIADVLGGGTPKTKEPTYWDGEIPFFAPKDAPGSFYVTTTEKHVTKLGIEKSSTKLYPKDTVFITARGTVGKVVLPSRNMAMNQSCYALKAKNNISQRFLFLMIKNQVAYLKKNTGGATFDTIVTDTFKSMKVILPLVEIIQEFDRIVEPIFDQMLNLINKNSNLKSQRDLLLPKLISGKIKLKR